MDLPATRDYAAGAATHLRRGLAAFNTRFDPHLGADARAVARWELAWARDDLHRASRGLHEIGHWDVQLAERLARDAGAVEEAIASVLHMGNHIPVLELQQAIRDARLAVEQLGRR